jgi:dTDP-4-dehydrorhamnose reductase
LTDTLLITGGSGYLGSRLARQARDTWQVVATYFSHLPNLPGCRTAPLDVRDGEAAARLLAEVQPTVVIHTAADMTSSAAMKSTIAVGTHNVASAAATVGSRLIHLSTDLVFDGEHGPYSEADVPRPVMPYGWAKVEAEQAVSRVCPEAAIVRTSLIYGFAPPDPRTLWVLDSLRQRRPITLFTDELRSPVWVDQLAAALLELAASDRAATCGVWHIAGPQPLSRYEFGGRLARFYGLDPEGLTSGLSRESGLIRPRNCVLEVRKAQQCLRSPLWGVDQVLAWAQAERARPSGL